jgi:putative colanic acid biosynthesis UDP-glucose lipid carrier transferase
MIVLAYVIVMRMDVFNAGNIRFTQPFAFIAIGICAWYTAAYFSTIYGDRRSKKFSEEIVFIIYTIVIFLILFSAIAFLVKSYFVLEATFFYTYVFILLGLMLVSKYAIRKYVHAIIIKRGLYENVLIIGSTHAALDFYEAINKFYHYGYKCMGYLDEPSAHMNDCKHLGDIATLNELLAKKNIDEVVIALPNAQSKQIQQCMELCENFNTNVRILPDFDQYTSTANQINNIGAVPIINVRGLPLDKVENKLLKRGFDIVFTVLFFVLIGWWLLPLIALLIKLSSRGPIIFKQERWGLNNEKIICYKFRTMVAKMHDLLDDGSFNQATKNDQRITRIGRVLRQTNFDELPQFWNVLVGNMSVVGPRPHATPMNIESMHSVDNYMLRHIILPGITGWAQVNGLRGETKTPGRMQKRVNYDLYYIHRWSFWLDLQIVLQTIINFIKGDENAY